MLTSKIDIGYLYHIALNNRAWGDFPTLNNRAWSDFPTLNNRVWGDFPATNIITSIY